MVSLDGSTLDVADEKNNDEAFGRPGTSRGASAYPRIRFVSLAEIGTHVLFGTQMAGRTTSEIALSRTVLPHLERGMLCLADRKLPVYSAIPPAQRKALHDSVLEEIRQKRVASSRNRRNPRGVKRKMSNFPLGPRHVKPSPPIDIREAIWIVK